MLKTEVGQHRKGDGQTDRRWRTYPVCQPVYPGDVEMAR